MGPGRPCSPDGGRFNKAWSDPGGVAKPPVPRPDRTERPDRQAGEGWLEPELSPLGCWSSEETQMVWLRFLPKLGKAPDFIPSRPHSQDESRAILSTGMNRFMGWGRNGPGVLSFHRQDSDSSQTFITDLLRAWVRQIEGRLGLIVLQSCDPGTSLHLFKPQLFICKMGKIILPTS